MRYPVPLDDVHAAWGWFAGATKDLGTDPVRLAIGGASAGVNLVHGSLAAMPCTRIVLNEYDDLRGSGELFELQLREVGVPVQSTVAVGMLHCHLNLMPAAQLPEIERSLDFLAAGLGLRRAG